MTGLGSTFSLAEAKKTLPPNYAPLWTWTSKIRQRKLVTQMPLFALPESKKTKTDTPDAKPRVTHYRKKPPPREQQLRNALTQQYTPPWWKARSQGTFGSSGMGVPCGWSHYVGNRALWAKDAGFVAPHGEKAESKYACDHGHFWEATADFLTRTIMLYADVAHPGLLDHRVLGPHHTSLDGFARVFTNVVHNIHNLKSSPVRLLEIKNRLYKPHILRRAVDEKKSNAEKTLRTAPHTGAPDYRLQMGHQQEVIPCSDIRLIRFLHDQVSKSIDAESGRSWIEDLSDLFEFPDPATPLMLDDKKLAEMDAAIGTPFDEHHVPAWDDPELQRENEAKVARVLAKTNRKRPRAEKDDTLAEDAPEPKWMKSGDTPLTPSDSKDSSSSSGASGAPPQAGQPSLFTDFISFWRPHAKRRAFFVDADEFEDRQGVKTDPTRQKSAKKRAWCAGQLLVSQNPENPELCTQMFGYADSHVKSVDECNAEKCPELVENDAWSKHQPPQVSHPDMGVVWKLPVVYSFWYLHTEPTLDANFTRRPLVMNGYRTHVESMTVPLSEHEQLWYEQHPGDKAERRYCNGKSWVDPELLPADWTDDQCASLQYMTLTSHYFFNHPPFCMTLEQMDTD